MLAPLELAFPLSKSKRPAHVPSSCVPSSGCGPVKGRGQAGLPIPSASRLNQEWADSKVHGPEMGYVEGKKNRIGTWKCLNKAGFESEYFAS